VVLAGDHQQLPPTVKSEKGGLRGLRETLFEKCIASPTRIRMLEVQYRMHEMIMEFSPCSSTTAACKPPPGPGRPGSRPTTRASFLTWPWSFSTRPASGFQELTIAESRSTANPEEADLLLKRLPSWNLYDPADEGDLLTIM
jgi:hypothetical protein